MNVDQIMVLARSEKEAREQLRELKRVVREARKVVAMVAREDEGRSAFARCVLADMDNTIKRSKP